MFSLVIGYMLIYFMKGGKLPWMGLKTDDIRERYKMIGHAGQWIGISKTFTIIIGTTPLTNKYFCMVLVAQFTGLSKVLYSYLS